LGIFEGFEGNLDGLMRMELGVKGKFFWILGVVGFWVFFVGVKVFLMIEDI
jgi:hypothetical protein